MKLSINMNYRLIITVFIIIINISGIAWIQNQNITKDLSQIDQESYQKQDQAKKVYLKLLSKSPLFGFDNLMVDWLFLDFIQYYGDNQARELTGYGLSPNYFKTIVTRNPKFIQAYPFLEPATTLFALKPAISDEIITEGLKNLSPQIPYSPELWIMKGKNQILFLDDIEGATQSYRQAVVWAKQDRKIYQDQHIDQLERTVKFLKSNPDSRAVTASSWASLLIRAKDEKTSQKILDY